jgi:hypothetical protein
MAATTPIDQQQMKTQDLGREMDGLFVFTQAA